MRASMAAEADAAPADFWKLVLGSVGVVYGDIGTSPLYALREGLRAAGRDGLAEVEVIGIVSLLLWTLTLIVTLKYVVLILRADNNGEGGTLSLLALAQRAVGHRTPILFVLGVTGAALFYGDAAITPAISVLSAVEGLELVAPGLERLRHPDHRRDHRRAVLGAEPRHRQRLGAVRSGHAGLVRGAGAARARCTPATGRRSSTPSIPCTPSASSSRTASARCRSWARSSSRSPAPRRSMPTWATSAAVRSAPPGSGWSSRRWRSTTSAREAWCWPGPRRSRTPSS